MSSEPRVAIYTHFAVLVDGAGLFLCAVGPMGSYPDPDKIKHMDAELCLDPEREPHVRVRQVSAKPGFNLLIAKLGATRPSVDCYVGDDWQSIVHGLLVDSKETQGVE